MGNKSNVFHREAEVLEKVKLNVSEGKLTPKEIEGEYRSLSKHFEKLLKDTKVLTSVSDRLHHKLNDANEQLNVQKFRKL